MIRHGPISLVSEASHALTIKLAFTDIDSLLQPTPAAEHRAVISNNRNSSLFFNFRNSNDVAFTNVLILCEHYYIMT